MKSNHEVWLKRVPAVAVGLLLVALAVSVPAQRKAKHGLVNPNWGGSETLRQTALNAGYDAGIADGRNDKRRSERFDFKDESEYQSATKGYVSSLGDKTLYQRYFRAGFEKGYRDGWNGY